MLTELVIFLQGVQRNWRMRSGVSLFFQLVIFIERTEWFQGRAVISNQTP